MNILMYSNAYGGHTSTFISQDVKYLSTRHNLLYICDTILSSNSTSNENIQTISNTSMSFLQKILWKFDIKLNYKKNHLKKQVSELISAFKPDIIHCQFGIEALRLIDNLEDTSIPIIIQFRGFDASSMLQKKSYVKRLKEILQRDNFYAIFVSNSLKQNLQKYHINVSNSMILYSGIDLGKFIPQKSNLKNSHFTFLQVSSLVEKKGHEYTLLAFAKFLESQKKKHFQLILTGDGDRKQVLQQICKNLHIEDHVVFTGFVSPEEAKNLMEEADVFVHHSITPPSGDEEGIPNAIMEAMAMELPILSTYHAGIPELVTDGVNGYLVQEKDIETYALRMQDILSWKKLKKNREVIYHTFEINRHIQKLEEFYLEIKSSNHKS